MTTTETQVECSMMAEPQKEHHWLHKLVGEWTYEGESPMEPGKPPFKFTGTETVRSIGGLWIVCEGRGKTPTGEPATTLLTLGYDPKKNRYVGTWIGSMMTYLWVYNGEMDATEKVLTLNVEGPSMADPGKTQQYKEVIEFKSDDHRVFSSHMLGEDGKWTQIMTAHYHRKK